MNEITIKSILFFIYLSGAVWQDIRHRGIWSWYYIALGIPSIIYSTIFKRNPVSVLVSAGIGFGLLLIGKISGEEIGEGDGWFFVGSGLLLEPGDNLLLLLSGLFFCGIYSLTLTAAAFISHVSVRRLRLPFLPFLLPVGLGMIFL